MTEVNPPPRKGTIWYLNQLRTRNERLKKEKVVQDRSTSTGSDFLWDHVR